MRSRGPHEIKTSIVVTPRDVVSPYFSKSNIIFTQIHRDTALVSVRELGRTRAHVEGIFLSHYRGVELPKGCPVEDTGPQGGRGDPGRSRTAVRPRVDGKSYIPLDASGNRVTGRDVSFGAVPELMTVHVVGDGKASTFKGSPEFNTLFDLVILHNLTAICLYYDSLARDARAFFFRRRGAALFFHVFKKNTRG